MGTLVERKSRFVIIVKVADKKTIFFQLPQVKCATTEQSDESNGNQVKSDDVVQQPGNDQN
jgi:hypothetical protein